MSCACLNWCPVIVLIRPDLGEGTRLVPAVSVSASVYNLGQAHGRRVICLGFD